MAACSATPAEEGDSSAPAAKRPHHAADAALAADFHSPFLLTNFSAAQILDFRAQWTAAAGHPFPHLRIDNFLSSAAFLDELVAGLQAPETHWNQKRNDLYEFKQTNDLKADRTTPVFKQCRDLIYSAETIALVESITGCQGLSRTHIDLFAATYEDGGILLPHDDRLEGRKYAFILYLTPPDWREDEGGHLDLFSITASPSPAIETGPYAVAVSLCPRWNSFAFFEVSTASFHQVREVLGSRPRLSVGGWFHGSAHWKKPPVPAASATSAPPVAAPRLGPFPALLPSLQRPESGIDGLRQWINPMYLRADIKAQIREAMAGGRSIGLPGFILPARYRALLHSLQEHGCFDTNEAAVGSELQELIGPVHKRRYFRLGGLSADWDALLAMFAAPAFIQYITALTDGFPAAAVQWAEPPELRRFPKGCYTLMHDQDLTLHVKSLDVVWSLMAPPASTSDEGAEEDEDDLEWDAGHGGFISYPDADEADHLSIEPMPNHLSLVVRQPGNLRFVKYLNHHAPQARVDVSMSLSLVPS